MQRAGLSLRVCRRCALDHSRATTRDGRPLGERCRREQSNAKVGRAAGRCFGRRDGGATRRILRPAGRGTRDAVARYCAQRGPRRCRSALVVRGRAHAPLPSTPRVRDRHQRTRLRARVPRPRVDGARRPTSLRARAFAGRAEGVYVRRRAGRQSAQQGPKRLRRVFPETPVVSSLWRAATKSRTEL